MDALPDLDRYLDHVVVPGGPEHAWVGPIRSWQASWAVRADELRRHATDGARGRAISRALRQGFVLTRAQARMAGLPDAEVRRLLRAGDWSVPHHGVLAVTPMANHALAAAAAALVRGGCVSGESAAVLHGLPLRREPDRAVQTTNTPAWVADAALRERVVDRDALVRVSELCAGWPGVRAARDVVGLSSLNRPSNP